jgi:hypothetical protein
LDRHIEGERERAREKERERVGIWTDLNIYDITTEVCDIQYSTFKSDLLVI